MEDGSEGGNRCAGKYKDSSFGAVWCVVSGAVDSNLIKDLHFQLSGFSVIGVFSSSFPDECTFRTHLLLEGSDAKIQDSLSPLLSFLFGRQLVAQLQMVSQPLSSFKIVSRLCDFVGS